MPPVTALKLLSNSIEILARLTGDVPPTPPLSQPNTPNMGAVQAEKEDLARSKVGETQDTSPHTNMSDGVDGVAFTKSSIGSPESLGNSSFQVIGADSEPARVQHNAITRKFYSKKAPPISLEKYLLRIHRYCPLSTAVYLAASLYIHRLAVVEKILYVTRLNSHRLLLAALRVAMKASEDTSYAHQRFAKVGGVSEMELGKLEISFCYLTNFELKIDKEVLQRQASILREIMNLQAIPGFHLKLPSSRRGI
jgi:Cyclin